MSGCICIAKLRKYKSPGSDQIPAELIQAEENVWTEEGWSDRRLEKTA
jgi:hypothetical protein